jgi:hypothetical protein
MSSFSVVDLLQSSGPIALNELVMRLSAGPQEAVKALKKLQSEGNVSISGPLAGRIRDFNTDQEPNAKAGSVKSLTDDEILGASDTFIEPSASSMRRSLAGW